MPSRNTAAAALIAVTAVIDAATLLGVSHLVSGPLDHSLAVGLLAGTAVGSAVALGVFAPRTLTCGQFWRRPWRYVVDRDFGLYAASRLDWPLLAAAAALVGGLPTAVLRGSHTMLFIPLLHKMTTTPDSERWARVGRARFLLVAATFAGSVLALAAQHDPDSAAGTASGLAQTAAGASLAVAGTVCASLSAVRFPLAISMHQQLSLPTQGPAKEIPAMLLAHIVACMTAATLLCVVFGLPDLSRDDAGWCARILRVDCWPDRQVHRLPAGERPVGQRHLLRHAASSRSCCSA